MITLAVANSSKMQVTMVNDTVEYAGLTALYTALTTMRVLILLGGRRVGIRYGQARKVVVVLNA